MSGPGTLAAIDDPNMAGLTRSPSDIKGARECHRR